MTTANPGPRRPILLAAIVTGFGAALLMWSIWLALHSATLALEGTTAPYALLGAVSMVALLGGAGLGGLAVGRAGSLGVGLGAGLVAGVLALLLLGSKVVEQPTATEDMADAANRLRPDAIAIVLGFLGVCGAVGAIGGLIGALGAPRGRACPDADRWLAWFGVITTVSMLPLIMIGGAVTSTESGMAVPDGVTSYGAFSALFPISLMSEPRIFLEHSHRLFGSLVGLTSIALMFSAIARAKGGGRWAALVVGLVIIACGAGAMGTEHAGVLPAPAAIGLMALIGLGALGYTHAMISRANAPGAASGLFALITIQGLYGIVRVDENLAWVAAFHGAFAQFVFATGAMVAALLYTRLHGTDPLDDETSRTARSTRKLALLSLIATSVQLVFGAVARHFDSMHGVLTHAGFAFVVIVLVIVGASACRRAGQSEPIGRALRWTGAAIFVVVVAQFMLGWLAFMVTQMGGGARPIPEAAELAEAHPLPIGEAIVTTSHQTGGALLIALVALSLFWARRACRAAKAAGNA